MGAFFRFIAYASPSLSLGQSFAGPLVAQLMMFAGFLITHVKLANWLVWLYWISPLSWGIRTLAQNEFDDGKYDFLIGDMRAGDSYIDQYAFQIDWGFKWGGIGYLVRRALNQQLCFHTRASPHRQSYNPPLRALATRLRCFCSPGRRT